jgi:hypothetical protein
MDLKQEFWIPALDYLPFGSCLNWSCSLPTRTFSWLPNEELRRTGVTSETLCLCGPTLLWTCGPKCRVGCGRVRPDRERRSGLTIRHCLKCRRLRWNIWQSLQEWSAKILKIISRGLSRWGVGSACSSRLDLWSINKHNHLSLVDRSRQKHCIFVCHDLIEKLCQEIKGGRISLFSTICFGSETNELQYYK